MRRKAAALIVRFRIPLMILVFLLSVFCATQISRVQVNYDMTQYLSEDTATKRGLSIMNGEFSPVSSLSVVLENAEEDAANAFAQEISALDGVMTASHDPLSGTKTEGGVTYRLISVMLTEKQGEAVLDQIESMLRDTPHLISGGAKDNRVMRESIISEMPMIMLLACAIVLIVLLLMSRSWLEPAVFFLVIAVSILLNMGTNWIFDSISFVTFAVSAILQLALAMDYSIMLINAFDRLRGQGMSRSDAMTQALADSFMPIASSSLTTVAGMLALVFMNFKIGFDIGMVLAKGIVLSMLTVFLFMPGLLMLFSPLLDKTSHKPLHISGRAITRLSQKGKGLLPILLIVLILLGAVLQQGNTYTYTVQGLDADSARVTELFGSSNQVVLLFPKDTSDEGYARQTEMLNRIAEITAHDKQVVSGVQSMVTTGAAALEYHDAASAAALIGYDEATVQSLFNTLGIKTPIRADALLQQLSAKAQRFSFLVPSEAREQLKQAVALLDLADATFNGPSYARALITLDLSISDPDVHRVVNQLKDILYEYHGDSGALAGSMIATDDIATSFSGDMLRVTAITIVLVFIIILFSFRSAIIPALLVCVIQGAIFLNMALSGLLDGSVFFMCYLICVALQMGATIDYGILLTSHYRACRQTLPPREAIAQAMQMSLQTILTSGLALIVAGSAVGRISSVFYISSIGTMLARGACISVLLILFLLPQLLMWLDRLMIPRNKKSQKQ